MKTRKKILFYLGALVLSIAAILQVSTTVSAEEDEDILEDEVGDISVWVEWEGAKAPYAEISFGELGEYPDVFTVYEDDNWEYIAEDMPKVKDGEIVEYYVGEGNEIVGFESSVTGNAKDGYVITFTYVGGEETNSRWIEVMEVREDGNDSINLTVHLLADGQRVDSVVLNDENYFSYLFEGSEDSNINYTIEVEDVPGYHIEIAQDEESPEDYIIVVTQDGEPEICTYIIYSVNDEDGKPVEDVEIAIYDKDDNLIDVGDTDTLGEVEFENTLVNGVKYDIVVSQEGYEDRTIEVDGGAFGCELELPRGDKTDTGNEEDSDYPEPEVETTPEVCTSLTVKIAGENLEDVNVTIADENGNEVSKGSTNGNGEFIVNETLTEGEVYTLAADKDGYKGYNEDIRVSHLDCEHLISLESEGGSVGNESGGDGSQGTTGTDSGGDSTGDGTSEGDNQSTDGTNETDGESESGDAQGTNGVGTEEEEHEGAMLADTATNTFNILLGGLILVLGGLGAYLLHRRKNQVN